ncbi:hypothetical protein [Ammoniphilus sp. CFH 90114]|uniref:hypothetical protein n=1 Tax=Ammoniphilus sp. CFH 90114 TaxID=2493665 RepID=UPI0013E94AF5|nr:hypothetical protein [Ammoniphilus sp. CFH 90114]
MSEKKHPKNRSQCAGCGDPLLEAKEKFQDFQTEAAEEIYCPNCRHQKHFGVIHSE